MSRTVQQQALKDPSSTLIIRRAAEADITRIMELAASAKTAGRWSNAVYHSYCVAEPVKSDQVKILFIAGISTASSIRSSILGFAAFTAIAYSAGECELENMVVSESWRRQGVGSRLLKAGLLWCRVWCPAAAAFQGGRIDQDHSGVRLEVRASNETAIGFYERAGFTVIGSRTAYYSQPEEDAILMVKPWDSPKR